ncbi:hypothetical protein [Lamprobacter modestohalophilus]|uniref:hypothetical protein n=1 Tax=Lamprobacter modestohalophilus TaxID=1064514 RepID=UPI0019040643|nr:hypothetical protein [Lamprobacter modestohalophilus]
MLDIKHALQQCANQQAIYNNENDFENTLVSILGEQGYNPQRQQRYDCNELSNNEEIIADIICSTNGSKIALELKYVFLRDGQPGDPPAFSYDILKDCVKCEYLIRKEQVHHAYVIGLTNLERIWTGRGPRGWSREYGEEISKRNSDVITGFIKTHGRDTNRAIFRQRRYSLFLEYQWSFSWHDFSSADIEDGNGKTRAIVLSPNLGAKRTERSFGDYESCAVIPFLNSNDREEARQRREQMR